MKVKIDGQYVNMSFWSFFKMYLLSWAIFTAFLFAILVIIGFVSVNF